MFWLRIRCTSILVYLCIRIDRLWSLHSSQYPSNPSAVLYKKVITRVLSFTFVLHLDHFSTLLKVSRYRTFNAKQRIAKMGVVRKMLFALQTNWYSQDMIPNLISALQCVAQSWFSADDTIKPIVSFLAANLHEGSGPLR